jgi:hypothetical protein
VTIIAGFKSYQGIVICSDTQEGIEGSPSKKNVPKLRFEPSGKAHSGDGIAAAFCGAGQGPFIDKLIENAWQDAQIATGLDEACEEIEKSIKATYKEFGEIFQPGYCPQVQLIYGVKMHDSSRLFSAFGPVVNEKTGYDSAGAGYYIADFLAGRMYASHLTLQQCVILAAYILFQAKEHVEGCGGDSHIAVLRDDGVSGMVDWHRIETLTELLKYADRQTGEILLHVANAELSKKEFLEKTRFEIDTLQTLREEQQRKNAQHDSFLDVFQRSLSGGKFHDEYDIFGLPKPSTPQKLEGPQ